MTTTSYSRPWSPLHDVSVIAGAPNDGGSRDRGGGRSTPVRIENARRSVGRARGARATRVASEMATLDARDDRVAVRGAARARVRTGEAEDEPTTGHALFEFQSDARATNRTTILGGNRASRAMARKSDRLILRDRRRRAARRWRRMRTHPPWDRRRDERFARRLRNRPRTRTRRRQIVNGNARVSASGRRKTVSPS